MKKQLSISMTRHEAILGYGYLAFQLLVLPGLLLFVSNILPQPFTTAEINFLFFAINFIATTVIFRKFLVENGKKFLSDPSSVLLKSIYGFIGYWVINYAVGMTILRIYPDFYNVNDSAIDAMTKENMALMSFGTTLLAPVAEELLYRGLIFRGFYNKNPLLGYLVSTLAFACIHVVGYIHQYEPIHLALCLVQYLPAGICLAWAYAKTGNIFAPILIHITINQIGIFSLR